MVEVGDVVGFVAAAEVSVKFFGEEIVVLAANGEVFFGGLFFVGVGIAGAVGKVGGIDADAVGVGAAFGV